MRVGRLRGAPRDHPLANITPLVPVRPRDALVLLPLVIDLLIEGSPEAIDFVPVLRLLRSVDQRGVRRAQVVADPLAPAENRGVDPLGVVEDLPRFGSSEPFVLMLWARISVIACRKSS
jgi:hypothetical protein